jgi:hypothetical protein
MFVKSVLLSNPELNVVDHAGKSPYEVAVKCHGRGHPVTQAFESAVTLKE